MTGLGTIINVALIVFGGICGLLFGKAINERVRDTLLEATGVAVMMIGIGGLMEKMLTVTDGRISAGGTAMMIISIALGGLIGEIINIDAGINRFGEWLKNKTGSSGDNRFVPAFVSASCTVCIGAMAVIGSINDAIYGDYSILLAKGILDAIFICLMTASQGKGCVFSALPVALFQGSITLIACFAGSFLTEASLDNLSFVGSILIFCVGLNFIRNKKIRVANLLPSIIIAAVFGFFGI